MKQEYQYRGSCLTCERFRLASIILAIFLALMIIGRCSENKRLVDKQSELEGVYLKMKQKDDSIRALIKDARESRKEIDLIINKYLDSIEKLKEYRKIKDNEKNHIFNIVSERRTLDSLAEHVVF